MKTIISGAIAVLAVALSAGDAQGWARGNAAGGFLVAHHGPVDDDVLVGSARPFDVRHGDTARRGGDGRDGGAARGCRTGDGGDAARQSVRQEGGKIREQVRGEIGEQVRFARRGRGRDQDPIDGIHPHDIASLLDERGIAVLQGRTGRIFLLVALLLHPMSRDYQRIWFR